MTEGMVHIATRMHLKANGWLLVAGQFPGGSDDEVCILNITDPLVARDCSPDPRRHSNNKLVPDLIAYKDKELLIIEMKPKYSYSDYSKLMSLLTSRRLDFIDALERFLRCKNMEHVIDTKEITLVPGMAFSKKCRFNVDARFCYFLVESMKNVTFLKNQEIWN